MKMKRIAHIATACIALAALLAAPADVQAQKKKKKKATTVAAPVEAAPVAAAPAAPAFQELVEVKEDSAGYSTLSVRPIHVSDIMYKMSVWRRINFKEKCNEPFFSNNNEFSRILMDNVAKGTLQAYRANGDSTNRRLQPADFAALTMLKGDGGDTTVDAFTGQKVVVGGGDQPFLPKQLYIIEIKEDLIFDKQRSRQYYDIQTVTLVIPSDLSPKGVEVPVATFRYKDLVKLFATLPNAKWYNFQNRAEDKKLADAFDLRLFCSRIVKMSNPKDEPIESSSEFAGNAKAGLIASQQMEYDLVEKENELWDF